MDMVALVSRMGVRLTRDGNWFTPPPIWATPSASSFKDRNPSPRTIAPWEPAPLLSSSTKRLLIPPPQLEPDPAQFHESLASCAQSPPNPLATPSMADFLASFNFRDEEPSGPDSHPCASIDELQSQLRDVFAGKVTTTRAERIATRLDLAPSTELTLGVSEGENNVLEGLSTLDPSLGGAQSTGISTDDDGGQTARVVRVGEALINQPPVEPVLQRSIAKHIVAGVGGVDGSEWAEREASRATHGWIFSFVCKGSVQHWQRQHKSQPKALVADYSHKELDPLLSSRPAFDCRGTITVSFSRNSRNVSIDYDHIPLHRTVADLAALYKPPTPRHPLPTTDKQPKAPKQPASTKKKRGTDKTPGGEGSKPRKRKRKTDDVGGVEGQGVVGLIDASLAGELQDLTGQASQPGAAAGEEGGGSTGQQPQGQGGGQASAQQASVLLIINVSPEEAERRRNVAVVMLRDAGVDPDSLSPEQFNIFANQSPDLQKESLNMLVKYGAERLRIVHPGSKEGSAQPPASASSSTAPVQSNIQGSSSGPVTTNELVLQAATPSSTKKSRKKSQAANDGTGEADADANNTTGGAKKSRRRGPAKSRNACVQCKQRRVKCPREMPICSGCREAGLICEFPAPKQKQMKSSALVTAEDDQDDGEQNETGPEAHHESTMEHQHLHDDVQGYPELNDDSVHASMPIGDVLANNMGVTDWESNHHPSHYFQPTGTGVSEAGSSQPPQPSSVPLSDLVLPHGRPYYSSISGAEMQDETMTPPIAHEHRKGSTKAPPAHASGRNIATRAAPEEDHHNPGNPTAASDWSSDENPVTQAAAVVAAVVTSMQDQGSREPAYGMSDPSGAWNGAWRPTAALDTNPQQSSMGVPQQQNVTAASLQRSGAASPAGDVARANSRKAKNPAQGSDQQQQQQSNAQASGLQAPAGMAGSANYNSYDRYSSTRGTAEAPSTDRITYEPYSYQRDAVGSTTTYTSYGHASHATTAAAAAAPIPAQTATAMSSAGDRSGPQGYGAYMNSTPRNTSHSNSTTPYANANAQTRDFAKSNADASRSSRQGLNVRSQASALRPGQNGMKQERNYPAYPSHIQQQQQQQHHQQQQQQNTHQRVSQQQPNQHAAWYNFSNQPGASFTSTGGHGSAYSWNMPGDA